MYVSSNFHENISIIKKAVDNSLLLVFGDPILLHLTVCTYMKCKTTDHILLYITKMQKTDHKNKIFLTNWKYINNINFVCKWNVNFVQAWFMCTDLITIPTENAIHSESLAETIQKLS